MEDSIVELPLQAISWNKAYGINGSRMYKKPAAIEFQRDISMCYMGEHYDGDVELEIHIYRHREIDTDNSSKLIMDALQGKAYDNDSQVRREIIEKFKCEKGEDKIVIHIKEYKKSV